MIVQLSQLGLTLGEFWAPPRSSVEGGEIDFTLRLVAIISLFFFALIVGLILWMIVRFRMRHRGEVARSQITHSTALEIAWTLPPVVLVGVIFYFGFVGFLRISTPKANAMEVDVIGQKWYWTFEYALPDGGAYSSNELHLVVDRATQLNITSTDVIHSVFVPAFRVKRDAVPGRYNKLWFRPTRAGEFPLLCAEYCGTKHSQMIAKVVVHASQAAFDKWLSDASRAIVEDLPDDLYRQWKNARTDEAFQAFVEALKQQKPDFAEADLAKLAKPAIVGQRLYEKKGCQQCHTVTGQPMTGPTLKGLWGKRRVFTDGREAVAEENYLRQSILEPQAQIVENYPGVMNTYQGQLSDRQIDAIIAYIRSLSD